MTPGSLDPKTCRVLVGDERARDIEAEARAHAEAGLGMPGRPDPSGTYWDQVIATASWCVYVEAYATRQKRLERKRAAAGKEQSQPQEL